MLSSRSLCLAALIASATPALAQELTLPIAPGELRAGPVGFPGGGYSPRTTETSYDNATHVLANGTGNNFLGNCENVIEDCRFSPGPWAGATSRLITEVTFGIAVGTVATSSEQVLVIFWRLSDLNFEGWSGASTDMVNPAATPLGVARVDAGPLAPNSIYLLVTDLRGLPGGGVAVPDGDAGVAVQVAWITHGCTPASYHDLGSCLLSACASTSTRGIGFGHDSTDPVNPPSVGSTMADFGRDISSAAMCANIGRFIGNGGPPVNTGNIEHRFFNAGGPTTMAAEIRLRGTAAHCGSADFDCDGDIGTDADIESFFACLAGNCPEAPCASNADFNADGDVGTDADIESFFRVLAGGPC